MQEPGWIIGNRSTNMFRRVSMSNNFCCGTRVFLFRNCPRVGSLHFEFVCYDCWPEPVARQLGSSSGLAILARELDSPQVWLTWLRRAFGQMLKQITSAKEDFRKTGLKMNPRINFSSCAFCQDDFSKGLLSWICYNPRSIQRGLPGT